MSYKIFYKDKIAPPKATVIDKVLCIIEGQSELLFIKKLHELNHSRAVNCLDFLTKTIELSWGKDPVMWKDKKNCKFQGGNVKGSLTPFPVLESLKKENIGHYQAVLVMFDADLDTNSTVYFEAEKLLKSKNALIFYAEPCFEKETLALTFNQDSQDYIDKSYQIIKNSKCRWYKKNWQNIPKEPRFKLSRSSESLLPLLKQTDLKGKNPKVDSLVSFVAERFS